MKSILDSLVDSVKHLSVVRHLPHYFDQHEQRLVVQSVIIGVVVWAVTYGLQTAVHWLFHLNLHWIEHAFTPFVLFIPLLIGAMLVATISQWQASEIQYREKDGQIHELNDVEGDGLERAISLYYSSEPSFEQALTGAEGVEERWQKPTFSLAARKFVATLITLGSGGSGGLEASVTLIGESMSAGLFKPRERIAEFDRRSGGWLGRGWDWWRATNADDLQTAQLSGIAAAVAVLLGTPFAAAFFATEVMYRRRPIIEKLIYALISALTAFFLTGLVTNGHPVPFQLEHLYVPSSDWKYYGVLMLVALTISLMSNYFKKLRVSFDHGFHKSNLEGWQRHLLGAAITGVIAIGVHYLTQYFGLTDHGLELVLGTGESVLDMAFAGELTIAVALIALFAKMIATLSTITSGGSAGLLIPTLFFSTMIASIFANLFNYEPMVLIVPAMTASLVSIVNVPLAAILFVVEAFGSVYMVPSLMMLVVATILAHEATIYRTQRETYEKRQILPGVSVRRERIPVVWAGKTLIDLDFRKEFDLNVIGLVERRGEHGKTRLRLGTASSTVLESGDILVVLGRDERLEYLNKTLMALRDKDNQPNADIIQ